MKVDDNFLDQLEDLKDEADAIGDNKLERQIDNTITYFTRQHIAKDTNESLELEEAYDELEENLTKDQIQKKYNEMFGKNPQTKFADVAKALNTTEQEIAAALFSLPMFEADELEEADDMALVADLEADLKEGYSEFQRVGKGKKKTVARNKGEEEVYGAGVKKGEEIEKKKLKNKTTMKESLEILRMKKLAGLITEGEYAKALLREMEGSDIKLDVDDDYVEMSSDSGDYDGFIKDNGTISFSVVYDDSEDRDGMDFDDNNWKDILGSNHAFVKIAKSIPTEVETGSDYVMITVKADDLIERFK
jgi:hypothetical protein